MMLIPCLLASLGLTPIQEGSFSTQVEISHDLAFGDRWTFCRDLMPVLQTTSDACTGQPVNCTVVFSGHEPDPSGHTKITYDIRVLSPGGSVYSEFKDIVGHDGRGDGGHLVLWSRASLTLTFEAGEALGTYRVEVVAREETVGAVSFAQATVDHVRYEPMSSFEDDEEFDAWFATYHDQKQPTRIVPAFIHSVEAGLWEDTDTLLPTLGFFFGAFDENRWLLVHLLEEYEQAGQDLGATVPYLIAFLDPERSELGEAVPEGILDTIEAFKQRQSGSLASLKDWSETPKSGQELDYLWGVFLATGRFDPIQRLCTALDTDAADRGKPVKGMDRDLVIQSAVFGAAQWSISAQAKRYPLVMAYCRTVLEDERATPRLKRVLAETLDSDRVFGRSRK